MKMVFRVCSIPRPSESIEDKHNGFLTSISKLPPPWGAEKMPPPPVIGSALSVGVKAKNFLGKGIQGDVNYHFRGDLQDKASSDDFIYLTFNSSKINYLELIRDVFMAYVDAFDAYYGEVLNDEFIIRDHDDRKALGLDRRNGIFRIPAVGYFDLNYCRRIFGVDAEVLVQRIKKHVDHASVERNGIFFVLSYEALSVDVMDDLSKEIKALMAPLRT